MYPRPHGAVRSAYTKRGVTWHVEITSSIDDARRVIISSRCINSKTLRCQQMTSANSTTDILFGCVDDVVTAWHLFPARPVSPHYAMHVQWRRDGRARTAFAMNEWMNEVHFMAIASRASSVAAPKIWNNLPPSITACDNYCTFKSKLKTHLFTT